MGRSLRSTTGLLLANELRASLLGRCASQFQAFRRIAGGLSTWERWASPSRSSSAVRRRRSGPAWGAGTTELRVFDYVAVDGSHLSTESTRGRATVLVFIATYDMGSQVAVQQLTEAYLRHKPRINAGAIALEPPKNAPLAEAFGVDAGAAVSRRARRCGHPRSARTVWRRSSRAHRGGARPSRR